jgi:hypothetical protein
MSMIVTRRSKFNSILDYRKPGIWIVFLKICFAD